MTPMAVASGRKYNPERQLLTLPLEDTWHVHEYSMAVELAEV